MNISERLARWLMRWAFPRDVVEHKDTFEAVTDRAQFETEIRSAIAYTNECKNRKLLAAAQNYERERASIWFDFERDMDAIRKRIEEAER